MTRADEELRKYCWGVYERGGMYGGTTSILFRNPDGSMGQASVRQRFHRPEATYKKRHWLNAWYRSR